MDLEIKLRPEDGEQDLERIVFKRSGCRFYKILKKSLDARDKHNICWLYIVRAQRSPIEEAPRTWKRVKRMPRRTVVVGSGPAGLFCAIRLIRAGIVPLVVERGGSVEERTLQNERFFAGGELDEDCNIQFGEGGAGTFSDGKLNTQTKDPRNREVLETFVEFGAPPEILYLNKPHIGSDKLVEVVANMRRFILHAGGEVRFHTRFEGALLREGALCAVRLFDIATGTSYTEEASEVVLAIGHSSRDTFLRLHESGYAMRSRDFAVGVRIEHLQSKINFAQYSVKHTLLPPADYKLVSHAGERTVFTFCMCPGGCVVPAASERGGVVTNGMSNYARDGVNANAALLAQIKLSDFDRGGILDGVEFQRQLERASFEMGGRSYSAPVQRVEDFLCGRETRALGEVKPTYAAGHALCDLRRLFPACVSESLRAGILDMDRRLHGFADGDAVLTAAETRFSSPVRILRGEGLESVSARGVYPCGEGCGYSGGITSSAADGIRVAETICARYED